MSGAGGMRGNDAAVSARREITGTAFDRCEPDGSIEIAKARGRCRAGTIPPGCHCNQSTGAGAGAGAVSAGAVSAGACCCGAVGSVAGAVPPAGGVVWPSIWVPVGVPVPAGVCTPSLPQSTHQTRTTITSNATATIPISGVLDCLTGRFTLCSGGLFSGGLIGNSPSTLDQPEGTTLSEMNQSRQDLFHPVRRPSQSGTNLLERRF